MPAPLNNLNNQSSGVPDWLVDAVKTMFSWVILMPVAVIVAGKLLANRFKLEVGDPQLLKIPIFGILVIQASGSEVILGFTGFLFTLFFVSLLAGRMVYELFRFQFGVDPGQFNSLCVFSSFATVAWASILYLLSNSREGPLDHNRAEHARLIEQLSKKKNPKNKK